MFPVVASNGSQVLVSWVLWNTGIREKAILEGTTLSSVGRVNRLLGPSVFSRVKMIGVGDATLIAINAGANTEVWAVRDGVPGHIGTYSGQLAAFTGNDEGHALLATHREWFVIGLDGEILGRTPPQTRNVRDLRAVALGPDSLVMWIVFSGWRFNVEYDIHGITVAADGSTRTPRIMASSAIAMPAAAAKGERTMVVWPEPCPGCHAGEVLGPGTRATPFNRTTS